MKNILFAIAGALSLLSYAAIADTSFTEQQSLQKVIQANTEQKLATETIKYAQIIALAGDRQDELVKRKDEVTQTYKKWRDLKSAVEASPNKASFNDFKAIELAARAYSEASKAFFDLQKDILITAKIPSDDHAAYLVVTR